MKLLDIKGLPVKRVGALQTRPEDHHIKMLQSMAMQSGDGSMFVVHGPDTGVIPCLFAGVLVYQPDSTLVIVGTLSAEAQQLIDKEKLGDRVRCVADAAELQELGKQPDLYFVSDPECVIDGLAVALAMDAKCICIYDVCTAKLMGLPIYTNNAVAADVLKATPGRSWEEASTAVTYQKTRRGMLISRLTRVTATPPNPVVAGTEPETEQPAGDVTEVQTEAPAVEEPVAEEVAESAGEETAAEAESTESAGEETAAEAESTESGDSNESDATAAEGGRKRKKKSKQNDEPV